MKNAISTFFLGALIVLASTTAIANNDKNKDTSVEFRFIGKVEHQPVYQLDINAVDGEEYFISFSDRAGTVLYSDNIKRGTLTQRFMINADEVGDEVLTVSVTSRKTNKSHIFTIKRSQSLVEENTVRRVK